MAVYTKKGDRGDTSLIGGERVRKCDARVEAYGTLDELSAFVGVLHDQCADNAELQAKLMHIQRNLFTVEAVLACSESHTVEGLKKEEVKGLELAIDAIEKLLPPLRSWVIPGGDLAASYCHVCRTICRRAERRAVEIGATGTELQYLNRLSDYFFVLARKLAEL